MLLQLKQYQKLLFLPLTSDRSNSSVYTAGCEAMVSEVYDWGDWTTKESS
jgi:hypothetical protein